MQISQALKQQSAQEQDEAVPYQDVIAHYGGEIYCLCHSLTYCAADADDLFQDTLLAVLERRHFAASAQAALCSRRVHLEKRFLVSGVVLEKELSPPAA